MSQTRPEYVLKIDAQLAVQDHFNNNGFAGYRDAQKMLDRITAIPAADVVEVRHGQWINERWEGLSSFSAECSLCSKRTLAYFHYSYCPNCGVKMEG